MSLLVIAEHDNASLKAATLNAVTAAARIGGEIHILVAGSGCGAVAEQAAKVAGVAKVRVADAAHYGDQTAENLAALIVANAAGYTHILAAATSNGKNTLPRVAALLDVAQISEIISVVDADTFVRPIYAGNAMATVKSADAVKVITVRTTGFDAAAATGGGATVEAVAAGADLGQSKLIGRELTKSARPELGAAKIIVSGGRGMGSGENYHKVLEPLADKLGAAMGASRAAVDAGFRSQRLPGRPDRQDRRAAALHCNRHFRRDPASGRHEGLQGNRGDQQGPGCADLPGGRLRTGRRLVCRRSGTHGGAVAHELPRRPVPAGMGDRGLCAVVCHLAVVPARRALARPGRLRPVERLAGDHRPADSGLEHEGRRQTRPRHASPGATMFTLMFGPRLAILGLSLVLAGVTLNNGLLGREGWEAYALNALALAVFPALLADAIRRVVDRCLPGNFFIYVFVTAFFGAAITAMAAAFSPAACSGWPACIRRRLCLTTICPTISCSVLPRPGSTAR
jgi:electron transfer flavoprotein alpha subunit